MSLIPKLVIFYNYAMDQKFGIKFNLKNLLLFFFLI